MHAGNATMLLLQLLQEKDMYGYEMVETLASRCDNPFHLKEGSLYPLLHSLEQDHYVKSYIQNTPEGRSRRYYRLTNSGRKYYDKKKAAIVAHEEAGGTP